MSSQQARMQNDPSTCLSLTEENSPGAGEQSPLSPKLTKLRKHHARDPLRGEGSGVRGWPPSKTSPSKTSAKTPKCPGKSTASAGTPQTASTTTADRAAGKASSSIGSTRKSTNAESLAPPTGITAASSKSPP